MACTTLPISSTPSVQTQSSPLLHTSVTRMRSFRPGHRHLYVVFQTLIMPPFLRTCPSLPLTCTKVALMNMPLYVPLYLVHFASGIRKTFYIHSCECVHTHIFSLLLPRSIVYRLYLCVLKSGGCLVFFYCLDSGRMCGFYLMFDD